MLGNIGKIYLFFAGVLFIDVHIELCECVASYSDLEKWDTKIWGGFGYPKLRFAGFRNIHTHVWRNTKDENFELVGLKAIFLLIWWFFIEGHTECAEKTQKTHKIVL